MDTYDNIVHYNEKKVMTLYTVVCKQWFGDVIIGRQQGILQYCYLSLIDTQCKVV